MRKLNENEKKPPGLPLPLNEISNVFKEGRPNYNPSMNTSCAST